MGFNKPGSFEGFFSGGGLARLAQTRTREAWMRGESTLICRDENELAALDAKLLAEAARGGDALACKEKPVPATVWQTANQRLTELAIKAGVDVPPATVPQAAYDPTASLQAPLPWRLPGNVEFENYDVGGPNVSFNDTTEANQGGHYRKDAVDIKTNKAAGNGAVVGFTEPGEWMEYTISVAKAGNYRLSVAYAMPEAGKRIGLSLNGKPLGQAITFTPTASWDELKTMDSGIVALPEGDSMLRVTVEAGLVDLDRLQFNAAG